MPPPALAGITPQTASGHLAQLAASALVVVSQQGRHRCHRLATPLRRLFAQHWGVTPSAVAQTARVQRAKRLLSETSLPMAEVPLQAGFCNLRSFNAAFAQTYKRPPSEIRRSATADPKTPP